MDTDLVITFTQQQTYWLGLSATQWISIVASLVTFGIMIAALMQWRSNIKAHKQSHTPFLKIYIVRPEPDRCKEGYISIKNSGLGPAFIHETNILRNGEIVKEKLHVAIKKLVRHIGESGNTPLKATTDFQYPAGYPIGCNETIYLVKFDLKSPGEGGYVKEKTKREDFKIHIVYRDMFDQQHEILDPSPERSL